MKRQWLLYPALLFILAVYSHAQNGNTLSIRFAGVPSGTCAPFMLGINNSNGDLYDCTSGGAWNKVSGGGGGTVTSVTGTPNQIDVATGTTTPVLSISSTLVIPGTITATAYSTNSSNGGINAVEGTGAGLTPASGVDLLWPDSTAHRWRMNNNNGTSSTIPGVASAGTSGHLVAFDTNGIDLVDGGAAGSAWSALTNPSGNLALSMGTNTSIFSGTAATNQFFAWKNTTAAVVGTSQGSPVLATCGRAFHGSADVEDCMTLKELPGNGNDANITFTIGHTGTSTGTVSTAFPGPILSPTGTQALPAFALSTTPATGMWFPSLHFIDFVTNGTDEVSISDSSGGGPGLHLNQSGVFGWVPNAGASGAALDAGLSRAGVGVVQVSTTAANRAGLLISGDSVFVTTNFTTAANTNLQTITGLSWSVPATALNYNFHCHLAYSQATGTAAVAFGIQAATNNPTNIFATGEMYTAAGTVTTGVLPTLATTTATAVVTGTPNATGTNEPVDLYGTVENPASANAINIMVSTATSGDAVTVLRGSYCSITP